VFPRPKENGKIRRDLKLFLSHRGHDSKEQLVRALHYILKRLGVSAFFDQKDIRAAHNSIEEMANAISEAAIALGCSVAFDERAGAEP
jgi:hypothetical protein